MEPRPSRGEPVEVTPTKWENRNSQVAYKMLLYLPSGKEMSAPSSVAGGGAHGGALPCLRPQAAGLGAVSRGRSA